MKIKNPNWALVLKDEFEEKYYKNMWDMLDKAYEEELIYPPKEDVFSAFELIDYDKVKVVILGQDPYHGEGQAHGLSFSVKPDMKLPPSLRNIYKEFVTDLNESLPDNGYLVDWAKQGVLMINAILTVKASKASSHSKIGWEQFTDQVISKLNEREKGVVFVLWGNFAKSKETLITEKQHRIIKSSHPSPFSARKGFFGSKPFSTMNKLLLEIGDTPINWVSK